MQRVIREVRDSLCDLKLAIDGTIVMSPSLRASLDAMYDARIPEKWMKVNRGAWLSGEYLMHLHFCAFIFRFHGNRPHSVSGTPNCWNEMLNSGHGSRPIDLK